VHEESPAHRSRAGTATISKDAVHPAATETCDEIDDDCDGLVDDDDDSVEAPLWYVDADGDLYGDAAVSIAVCLTPEGLRRRRRRIATTQTGDIHPAADEYCDGFDNDCDGVVDLKDSDSSAARWYVDGDGDGVTATPRSAVRGAREARATSATTTTATTPTTRSIRAPRDLVRRRRPGLLRHERQRCGRGRVRLAR
jgi:hypothetical protein